MMLLAILLLVISFVLMFTGEEKEDDRIKHFGIVLFTICIVALWFIA